MTEKGLCDTQESLVNKYHREYWRSVPFEVGVKQCNAHAVWYNSRLCTLYLKITSTWIFHNVMTSIHTWTIPKCTTFIMVVHNILYTPYLAECPVQWNLSCFDQTTFFRFFSFLRRSALYNLQWGITVGKRYLASSSKLPYDKTPAKSYFLVHQLPTQPYSAACYLQSLQGITMRCVWLGCPDIALNAFATVLRHYHHTAILSERLFIFSALQ